jgi:hypothetical protein
LPRFRAGSGMRWYRRRPGRAPAPQAIGVGAMPHVITACLSRFSTPPAALPAMPASGWVWYRQVMQAGTAWLRPARSGAG